MSLRQLRRLELQSARPPARSATSAAADGASSDASSSEAVGGRAAAAAGGSVFLQAVGSDFQVSEAESDEAAAPPASLPRAADEDEDAHAALPHSQAKGNPNRASGGPPSSGESPQRRAALRRRERRRVKKSPSDGFAAAAAVEGRRQQTAAAAEEAELPAAAAVAAGSAAAAGAAEGERVRPPPTTCLQMERSAFDPEADLRRMFGRQVLRTSRTAPRVNAGSARSKRQWLVAPGGQAVPLVNPWMRMVASEDPETRNLEFSVEYTEEYVRMQPVFVAALQSHDPEVLREFCLANPLHPDGLFALSEALAVADMHELAFEALSRGVLSMQCAFHYGFSPFAFNPDGTPQVAVDSRNPVNRQLFACLLSYMIGLGEQGCHRCALEVCKLLLAMDLANDVSHALLHLDFYALRSRKFDFLHQFAQQFVEQHLTYVVPLNGGADTPEAEGDQEEAWNITDLRLALPSFAFSAALASFMQAIQADIPSIKRISARDVCTVYGREAELRGSNSATSPATHHCLLMHAILLFPSMVRRLLEKLQIKGEQKVSDSLYPELPWDTLLFDLPLWSQGFPDHRREAAVHDLLLTCYIEKTHELWRASLIVRWVHACAAHLFTLCRDSAEQQLFREYKTSWAASHFLVDLSRYKEARVSEFARRATLPSALMGLDDGPRQPGSGGGLRQPISLRSSPLVLFFQTLLPWNELDLTGLRAEPVFLGDLLAILKSCWLPPVEAAVRSLLAAAANTLSLARLALSRRTLGWRARDP